VLPRLDGRAERERLARPGGRAHDLDAVAAARQREHECALLVAQARSRVERSTDGPGVRDAGAGVLPGRGAVEQIALELQ